MKKILLKLGFFFGLTTTSVFGQIAEYNFDNTYNNVNGNTPFSNTIGISLGADRNGNAAKALVVATGYTSQATIANLPLGNAARSVSLWVLQTASSSDNHIFKYSDGFGATNTYYGLSNQGSDLVNFGYANDLRATGKGTSGANWVHVVTTFDGITAKIYRNGTEVASANKATWNTTAGNFILGSGETQISIDDLKIYNRALTATEVSNLYNNTTTSPVTTTPNIVNGTFDANTYTSTLGAYNSWSGYAGASTEFYGNADNSGVLTSSLTPVTQGGECIAWGKPKGNCIDWAPITISGYTLKNSSISQSVTIKEIPVSLTGVYKFTANLAKYNGLVLVDGNYNGTRFTDTLELKDYSSVVRTVTEADKDTISLTLGSHTEPCVKTCDGKICDDNCPVLDQVTITLQACGTCPSGAAEASNTTRMVVDNLKLNFSVPTAIEDELLTSQYAAVYPNPVIDILNVDGYAEVLNLMGEKVAEGNSKINVSSLVKGIYLVKSGNKITKIVKE